VSGIRVKFVRMKLPRFAAALAVGLVLVIAPPSVAAVSKTDRKQNKSLKALSKRAKAHARQLKSLNASVAALGSTAASLRGAIDSTTAAVTQLSSTLTTLRSTFTGYAAATEYGVVQLYFDPEGNGFEADDAVPNQLLTTADVPDDRSQATVTGRLVVSVPDGTTAKPLALKAGFRSGEKDGTGASNPAGVAGLMAMTGTMIGAPGTTFIGGGNPGTGGTLPLSSAPNAGQGGMPVYPVPTKAPRNPAAAPLQFPDAMTIELTEPSTLQTFTGAPSRLTVTNTSGGPAVAIFDVTVRFIDLSASATDLQE
jgi:uncharacterized protein YukE